MNNLHLYEKKIIYDSEFPVQLFLNRIKDKGLYFPLHWHEHIEFHYFIEGSAKITSNNKTYLVEKGNLMIINDNELHEGYCTKAKLNAIVLIFEMSEFSREIANQNIIFKSLIENDKIIQKLMLDIYKEYENNQIGYKLSAKGLVYQLIVYLMRNYAEASLSDSKSSSRSKNLIRLNTVLLYIEKHYSETITNAQLSSLIHLSEDRFNHLFKESMGISPLKYINDLRIKKAKKLLKAGQNTVSEVAMAVGFNDINHFSRMFKRKYGLTPSSLLKAKQ